MLDKEAEDDALSIALRVHRSPRKHVAEVIMKAIKSKSVEVFIPPERGRSSAPSVSIHAA